MTDESPRTSSLVREEERDMNPIVLTRLKDLASGIGGHLKKGELRAICNELLGARSKLKVSDALVAAIQLVEVPAGTFDELLRCEVVRLRTLLAEADFKRCVNEPHERDSTYDDDQKPRCAHRRDGFRCRSCQWNADAKAAQDVKPTHPTEGGSK